MAKTVKEPLTIIIGGDMDKDDADLFAGKRLDQPRNILYVDSFEELSKMLSPKRLQTLQHLMRYQTAKKPKSISQVALETKRFQEAISSDVKQLNKLGLVDLKKEKQTVYAYPRHKSIHIMTK
jgi:predicted transcriptional regulator